MKKEITFRVSVVGLLAAILVVQMVNLGRMGRKPVPPLAPTATEIRQLAPWAQTSAVKPWELFQNKTNSRLPDFNSLKPYQIVSRAPAKPSANASKTFSFEEAQQPPAPDGSQQQRIADAQERQADALERQNLDREFAEEMREIDQKISENDQQMQSLDLQQKLEQIDFDIDWDLNKPK
jgi:hypothetical protein